MKDNDKKRNFALKLAVLMMVLCLILTISAVALAEELPASEPAPETQTQVVSGATTVWQIPSVSWVVIVVCSVVAAALLADSVFSGRRRKNIE